METGGVDRTALPSWRQQKGLDAEVCAIYQALRLFEARSDSGVGYTVFSDSTAAISRAQTGGIGPGQAFSRAIIEASERLKNRGCSVTLRWKPSHKGVEGNEVADGCAKQAAESARDPVDRPTPAGGQPRPLDEKNDRGEDPGH